MGNSKKKPEYSKFQIKQKKEIEWTNQGCLKLSFVMLSVVILIVLFIKNGIDKRDKGYELINSNNMTIKGIVIKKSIYKGNTIRVKFRIKNTIYTGSDGLHKNKNVNVGDSVYIKYYVKDPNFFITEFNENW